MLSGLVAGVLTIIPWYEHEVQPIDFTGSLIVCESRDQMVEYISKSFDTDDEMESRHDEIDGCTVYVVSERDEPVVARVQGMRYTVTGLLLDVRVVALYESDYVRGRVIHLHSNVLSGYSLGSLEFVEEIVQVEK